jgi:hypothetical protein
MNKKLGIFALLLVIAATALALRPAGGGPNAADLSAAFHGVYLAEMEGQVCASSSPVHTTLSLTTANADAESGDTIPNVDLVVLENGVCASLSPISTSEQPATQGDPAETATLLSEAGPPEIQKGIWYVQH